MTSTIWAKNEAHLGHSNLESSDNWPDRPVIDHMLEEWVHLNGSVGVFVCARTHYRHALMDRQSHVAKRWALMRMVSGLPLVRVLFLAPFAPAISVKTGGVAAQQRAHSNAACRDPHSPASTQGDGDPRRASPLLLPPAFARIPANPASYSYSNSVGSHVCALAAVLTAWAFVAGRASLKSGPITRRPAHSLFTPARRLPRVSGIISLLDICVSAESGSAMSAFCPLTPELSPRRAIRIQRGRPSLRIPPRCGATGPTGSALPEESSPILCS